MASKNSAQWIANGLSRSAIEFCQRFASAVASATKPKRSARIKSPLRYLKSLSYSGGSDGIDTAESVADVVSAIGARVPKRPTDFAVYMTCWFKHVGGKDTDSDEIVKIDGNVIYTKATMALTRKLESFNAGVAAWLERNYRNSANCKLYAFRLYIVLTDEKPKGKKRGKGAEKATRKAKSRGRVGSRNRRVQRQGSSGVRGNKRRKTNRRKKPGRVR